MFCNKCGNEVDSNQQYCNKCGNVLRKNKQTIDENDERQKEPLNYNQKNNQNKKIYLIVIGITSILVILLLAIVLGVILKNSKGNYYFSDGNQIGETQQTVSPSASEKKTKGKYKTAIITDNVYSGISVTDIEDANQLIREDSVKQKQFDYPKEIIQIENNIIEKYSITAVNLKEMDVEFVKELEKVIGNIYKNYPSARGHLTNLTLTNLDMSNSGVIALFMPVYTFATSDTSTTRPWVIKTQIQLNAKYFLNPERMDAAVKTSSKAGHFPPNATRYSPVAHEFGHYLSFLALMNYYSTDSITIIEDNQILEYYEIFRDFGKGTFSKKMLEEAYQNYVRDNGNIGFDEWRGQISEYALAKNDMGDYIYDETIAEAFHDVYLNNENAKTTSKYIIEVLKKYIEG